jgi:hypothetical protein
MKKKTAVEWFFENLNSHKIQLTANELFEQAKQVEKGQMEYMFECGRNFQLTGEGAFTQVYNETYGTE